MIVCSRCGRDVSGKKFCPDCGTPVVSPTRTCPACQAQVVAGNAFCTECDHNMNAASGSGNTASAFIRCPQCGHENRSDVRFCGACGGQLGAVSPAPAGQYNAPAPSSQTYSGYPNQNQSYPAQQYAQVPAQQQYVPQGGYQQQPMLGQGQMVLRCPTCMAMSPVGAAYCPSCRTNLAGVVPTPANMQPGQQGGFLQGNGGGNTMMGALGGAAAVIGGEMLLKDLTNGHHHHRRDDDDDGVLGSLGELGDDLGLF